MTSVKKKNIYKNAQQITKDEWKETEKCDCGGPLLRYFDISRNTYVLRCGYTQETYDTKLKKWITSKKKQCDFFCIHREEKPVFKKKETHVKIKDHNQHKLLRIQLESLFDYYLLDPQDITLQEIDYIVKFKLWRRTRTTNESIEDYKTRLFSLPIVDKYSNSININNVNYETKENIIFEEPEEETEEEPEEEPEEENEEYSEYDSSSDHDEQTSIIDDCEIEEEELYDDDDEPDDYYD